eukprot:3809319-Rhodomonas_salina.4
MSGTDIAHGATREVTLSLRELCGEDVNTPLPLFICNVRALPTCYAMPGTDLAYAASSPRACYGMSGTDLAYHATTPRACGNATEANRCGPTRALRDVRL